jgi:hypothetical protein
MPELLPAAIPRPLLAVFVSWLDELKAATSIAPLFACNATS